MVKIRKLISAIIFSSIFSICVYAQNTVAFFGAISSSEDTSTIDLTEDLYFSKASLISDIHVSDFRNRIFKESDLATLSNYTYVFYPEIQENGEGWKCTFHGINVKTKEEILSVKNYDSYYKILMEAKNELDSFFTTLKFSETGNRSGSGSAEAAISGINMESLSGTWKGENYIDKIIILRGGRGFVIFQNGASMNISVTIDNNTLIATQNCSSNASFFPEVSREIAMNMAPTAEPIVWKMKVKNGNMLEGTKHTLQPSNETAHFANIPVIWTKLQ